MSQGIPVFDKISDMDPLLPEQNRPRLAELSKELMIEIGRVSGQIHSPVVRSRVADLIRGMNCYYSNLLEGHKTIPHDIERALNKDYSRDPKKRDNQLLSKAHIAVEKLMLQRLEDGSVDVYSPTFICWLHKEFYSGLPETLHYAKTKDGETYKIEPGICRDFMVVVGRHTPPKSEKLNDFLERFCNFYGRSKILDTNRLIAIAAAHHRLAWIHPFGDGNGRVMRLYSHALLIHHGLDGGGLWTLSRGLARQRERYFELLEGADQQRKNDYDGRGNLSDQALAKFCEFFLEVMLNQVKFMGSQLDLPGLRKRIERFFQLEMTHLGKNSEFLMRVVRVLADEGEIPRGRVQEITGRGETFCRGVIQLGLKENLFDSPNQRGPLRIAFPSTVLESYFPRLYLDLDE